MTERSGGQALKDLFWGTFYVMSAIVLEVVSTIGLYRDIGVTPWSPAAGLALTLAFLRGRMFWPYLTAGMFLAGMVSSKASLGFLPNAVIAVGATMIVFAAATTLRRLRQFDPLLRTVQAALILVAIAAVTALGSTSINIGMVWLLGLVDTQHVVAAAWRFLVGDVVGMLVVAPLVLMIAGGADWPRLSWTHLAQLIVLLMALLIIFTYRAATTYQLFYLLFLPIMWVALRDGVQGATLALNMAQLGVVIGAQLRFGITPGTGALQMMMIVLTITGLLVGVVVTERQAAARWLRNQQAAMGRSMRLRSAGETAAAIAHQVNQPLTAITTFATLAAEAIEEGRVEAAKSPMAKVLAECERAAVVLRSIRDLVKQGALTRENTRLLPLLNQLQQLHLEDFKTHAITFRINMEPGLETFDCDPVQVEQALENLMNNSIEAIGESGKPGRIEVSCRMQGDDLVLEIADDGPGFAPGLDAIATTPFMTTKSNGSGLGLAVARSVAEAHGGSLSILPRSSGAAVQLTLAPRARSAF